MKAGILCFVMFVLLGATSLYGQNSDTNTKKIPLFLTSVQFSTYDDIKNCLLGEVCAEVFYPVKVVQRVYSTSEASFPSGTDRAALYSLLVKEISRLGYSPKTMSSVQFGTVMANVSNDALAEYVAAKQ